jgi:PAB-dependent poly(A)-specific ribonuclease subunit 3
MYETRQDLNLIQQEDIAMFGKLVLALCCNSMAAVNNVPKALELIARNYNSDLRSLAQYLVTKPTSHKVRSYHPDLYTSANPSQSIRTALEMMSSRVVAEMVETHKYHCLIIPIPKITKNPSSSVDRLESELMSELENARLVRLLCKFGFINERPEFGRSLRWSETGDRYIVKLFRDYVFHQVDEHGEPVVDLGHVLTCLSKVGRFGQLV